MGTRGELIACLKDYIGKGKTSLLTKRYEDAIKKADPGAPGIGLDTGEEDGIKASASGGVLESILRNLSPEHHVPEKYYHILEAVFIE